VNYRRLRAVFRKEAIHILRDWRSLVLALAIPMLLILLFGYALTLDVDRIPTAVLDRSRTPESRELIERFAGSRYFTVHSATDFEEIRRGIDRNEVLLGIVVPHDYARTLAQGGEASVQLVLDGSDSNTASIAAGYAEAVVQAQALELRRHAARQKGLGELKVPAEARTRVLYNSELKSKNYIIPGLIAVIMSIIAALITSLTIAREWESGTMEQLLSAPVRPGELLLGKLAAYFVLGMADMAIALVVGVGVFGVPLRGSLALLVFASALFLVGALSWGILISTVTRSQLLAFQVSLLSSFLPAFLLSGFLYSIENMPLVIQQLTRIIPARYFVAVLQGVFLKGTGVALLWHQIVFLLLYAGVVFTVAARKMRQKVA
jgi:ABC-2 type transport system permease protein